MTTGKMVYENATITLPKGLKAEGKACGFNVSAICATAIRARIDEHKRVLEYAKWLKANPGNAIHITSGE